MKTIDPMLFTDVADALTIGNPVIVEKDYYAVLLLKELSSFHCEDYQLVFAGGTCLTKVHQNTYRMSEDIDIKLVASNTALGKSHSPLYLSLRLKDPFVHYMPRSINQNQKLHYFHVLPLKQQQVKNLYRYFVELLRVVEILHKLMTKL